MDRIFSPNGTDLGFPWQDFLARAPRTVSVLRQGERMSVKRSEGLSYSIWTAVAVALGTVAMLSSAPPVLAANADKAAGPPAPAAADASGGGDSSVLEEITVTGTRIKRKDLESSSPLVTVDSAVIEQRAGLNLESYLNQLPNYNPAQTPTTDNFDVQPSAVNTVGISTISLRGFGPNRSLVLIDGHRTTPVNALMVTDINSIPAAMIDRVEIITGGASATYGADAIGGVTNFILKKNFQGAQIDLQDGITQAGDGNEARVSALMGSKIGDGKGNIIMGLEWYDRKGAFQRNRDFYTNSWTDPNAPQQSSNALFVQGFNAYDSGIAAAPSNAAIGALFPNRPLNATGAPLVYGYPQSGAIQNIYFNPGGSMWTQNGPIGTSGYTGPTSGNGYGLQNALDTTMVNAPGSPPNQIQTLKWNNPLAYVSSPQTRYSFFANGDYDITDKIQFYTNARFAQSRTQTLLPTPTTAIFGWEANVPYNATTDSPINPALITPGATPAALSALAASFAANPTSSNPNWNPSFVPIGSKGAQHPVPWQLALLLNSRGPNGVPPVAGAGPLFGGPTACLPQISATLCSSAPSSWQLWYLPQNGAPQRSTVDISSSWQIETGFRFPLFSDWTGDLYYSRGQSLNYENGYGNDSLNRYRAVVQSPGYGQGLSFQGNANGANANFGTSVPSTCTSGLYGSIFSGDVAPSADCQNAIGAVLQTLTAMEQDIVEANFQGTLFKLPAGDVSAAVGYQYRRDSAQFTPDGLQSTNSFLDQTVGLYPLGTLQGQDISAKDGYAELFVPVLTDLGFLKKLSLDLGGRYSSYSVTSNSTTFKVNMEAQLGSSLRLRGGFNRATRAPNLGELYLGTQEYFGGGPQFGDPCSVRSNAPYGAGGAAPDTSPSGTAGGVATKVVNSKGAAGALSTYLICQAQMGGAASATSAAYYNTSNQITQAAGAAFAWLNEEGNPNLRSETADTWTAGFVFNNLSDQPLLSGISGSLDWWQVHIRNAIELDSPDYANFLCYGGVTVTDAAGAAAQAATPACQNAGRLASNGNPATTLLQYTNQGTIGTAGVDLQLNWIGQLADMGIKVPGALTFNTQDTFLQYYRTKQSPASIDPTINWKDSLGPTLAGTNPGAYGFRLFTSVGYSLPAFNVNLRWRFLPSVNTAEHAAQQGIIDNNNRVAAGANGTILSYIPYTDLAAPAWSAFDLSGSWNVTSILQVRAGINNLFDKKPAVIGTSEPGTRMKGYPPGTDLSSVCSADAAKKGCVNPTSYSLPSDGGSLTNAGYYDVYGRTFFLGFRAQF
jgi:outer membrane receptor protein involved in Fe transport